MKCTVLKLSFCASLMIHGAIFPAVYVLNHASARVQSAPPIQVVEVLEIVSAPKEPEIPLVSQVEIKMAEATRETVQEAPVSEKPVVEKASEPVVEEASEPIIAQNVSGAEVNPVTYHNAVEEAPVREELATAIPGAIQSSANHFSTASYLINPKPIYPPEARRKKQEGLVILKVVISKEGKAESVNVEESSGCKLLDESASAAVKGWQFVPGRAGDEAIESTIKVPVRFRLAL